MNNIFFTADPHFDHKNIIKYTNRPFKDVHEMNNALVNNWNSVVGKSDHVYVIGDFCLSNRCDYFLDKLNGNKTLITGNHDKSPVLKSNKWSHVTPMKEIRVKINPSDKSPQLIVLLHYAMRIWRNSHYGSWMLYGHSHGTLSDIGGKTIDIGVDCHNYTPLSLKQISEIMKEREITNDFKSTR